MHPLSARMRELQRVPVPPELDALVFARARAEFCLQAHEPAAAAGQGSGAPRHPQGGTAVVVPHVERWIYAVGLLAYGSQAVGVAARMLWQAIRG